MVLELCPGPKRALFNRHIAFLNSLKLKHLFLFFRFSSSISMRLAPCYGITLHFLLMILSKLAMFLFAVIL